MEGTWGLSFQEAGKDCSCAPIEDKRRGNLSPSLVGLLVVTSSVNISFQGDWLSQAEAGVFSEVSSLQTLLLHLIHPLPVVRQLDALLANLLLAPAAFFLTGPLFPSRGRGVSV